MNTARKAINGSSVHVFGVAYKKDVNDMRESPALDVMELLLQRGATLSYTDPWVPTLSHGSIDLSSIDAPEAGNVDCAVICTNHVAFDYTDIAKRYALIVDTRNAMKGIAGKNIFRL